MKLKKYLSMLLCAVMIAACAPNLIAYAADAAAAKINAESYITKDGSLWIWGNNVYGQLTNEKDVPAIAMTKSEGKYAYFALTGGNDSNLKVTSDGKLMTVSKYEILNGNKVVEISGKESEVMSDVSMAVGGGSNSIFALKTNKELWIIPKNAAKPYKALSNVNEIVFGSSEVVYALTKDGKVYLCENIPFAGRATNTEIMSKAGVSSLVGAEKGSASSRVVYAINKSGELVKYDIVKNKASTVKKDVAAASVGYFNKDVYSVDKDGKLYRGDKLISENEKFVSVSASHGKYAGCTAIDKSGNVWAYGLLIPSEYNYFGTQMVKIFNSNGEKVEPAKLKELKIKTAVNSANKTIVNIEVTAFEGAVGYVIKAADSFGLTKSNVIKNTSLRASTSLASPVQVVAVDKDGNALAAAEFTNKNTNDSGAEFVLDSSENGKKHSSVVGRPYSIKLESKYGKNPMLKYEVKLDKKVVGSCEWIKADSLDEVFYPSEAGKYEVTLLGKDGEKGKEQKATFTIDVKKGESVEASSINLTETSKGTYKINFVSPTGTPSARTLYIYSDAGKSDIIYGIDKNGKEVELGKGSAEIKADSGIKEFGIKSSGSEVSVVTIGFGKNLAGYIAGEKDVKIESALPVCSMFIYE